MITIFLWTTAIVFTILAVIWQKSSSLNVGLKLFFVALTIWSWYIVFHLK